MYGLLSVIVLLIGAWCKSQESKIKDLERFKERCMSKWLEDSKSYVNKSDFDSLAKELKESLLRIEGKVEKAIEKSR
jgi:hypothetical protein